MAASLVLVSLLLADTRPETGVHLGIHLIVGAAFLALGPAPSDGFRLRTRLSRLLGFLPLSGLLLCWLMTLVTYAILARIDEGFAVFG